MSKKLVFSPLMAGMAATGTAGVSAVDERGFKSVNKLPTRDLLTRAPEEI